MQDAKELICILDLMTKHKQTGKSAEVSCHVQSSTTSAEFFVCGHFHQLLLSCTENVQSNVLADLYQDVDGPVKHK